MRNWLPLLFLVILFGCDKRTDSPDPIPAPPFNYKVYTDSIGGVRTWDAEYYHNDVWSGDTVTYSVVSFEIKVLNDSMIVGKQSDTMKFVYGNSTELKFYFKSPYQSQTYGELHFYYPQDSIVYVYSHTALASSWSHSYFTRK